ncbi:MAG: ADP-ribosylation factor-like protein [Promethearchaeota archaeon]
MLIDFLRLIKGFILVIGPKEAGKTSILRRLVTGTFEEHKPTLGFHEEKIARMRIIEIGGHQNFKDYWKIALEQSPVHIFYVIDITKKSEFTDYRQFLDDFNHSYPQLTEKTTLIANKIDLTIKIPEHFKEIKSIILSSAKNGEGMFDILETIAKYKDSV